TELAEQLSGIRNLMVSVKEAGDHIIFLRKVEPGKADRSYGIEVARLAGFPLDLIRGGGGGVKADERNEDVVAGGLGKGGGTGAGCSLSSWSRSGTDWLNAFAA